MPIPAVKKIHFKLEALYVYFKKAYWFTGLQVSQHIQFITSHTLPFPCVHLEVISGVRLLLEYYVKFNCGEAQWSLFSQQSLNTAIEEPSANTLPIKYCYRI